MEQQEVLELVGKISKRHAKDAKLVRWNTEQVPKQLAFIDLCGRSHSVYYMNLKRGKRVIEKVTCAPLVK